MLARIGVMRALSRHVVRAPLIATDIFVCSIGSPLRGPLDEESLRRAVMMALVYQVLTAGGDQEAAEKFVNSFEALAQ
jgi:hypothetical protein